MTKVLVVQSTSRPGAAGNEISQFVYQLAQQTTNLEPTLVKLGDLKLGLDDEPNLPATKQYVQTTTKAWSALVEGSDVLVFVCPEYNGSYPALLKNAVDHLKSEWEGKKVAFVTYSAGGAKFVPQALETLFKYGVKSEVLGNISFSTYPYGFDTVTGQAKELAKLAGSKVEQQLKTFLASLA